jgi:hypothetical protein
MSINIPGLPRIVNKVILDFSQMDVLPAEEIIFSIIERDRMKEVPINEYF